MSDEQRTINTMAFHTARDMADAQQRIRWLEQELTRVVQVIILGLSGLVGYLAYKFTVDSLGSLGAFGIAIVAAMITSWWLHRDTFIFSGASWHVKPK
jgi:hypothetical protein